LRLTTGIRFARPDRPRAQPCAVWKVMA